MARVCSDIDYCHGWRGKTICPYIDSSKYKSKSDVKIAMFIPKTGKNNL